MKTFFQSIVEFKQVLGCSLPEGTQARRFARKLFEVLFICKGGVDNNEFELKAELKKIETQLQNFLYPVLKNEQACEQQADRFMQQLPVIYNRLLLDAQSICEGDPAAKDVGEVIVAYPGFFAIAVYRFANQLWQQGISLVPRMLSEYAHSYTGIDIHPGATIGESFSIDHGTGIVIGETAVIGNNVKIYQGATLGALSVQKNLASSKRHPTIEDNVVIYAGATILGGDTVVGHDSIIGGNVWLTQSVQPFSVVYHQAEITIQDKKTFNEPYNFFI